LPGQRGQSRFSACADNAALWREHVHAFWRPHERGEPGGRRKKLFGGRGHRLLLPTRDLVSGFITDRLAHGGGDMRLGHAVTVLSQIGLSGAFDPCGHAQRHVFQSFPQIPRLPPLNQPQVER
jgi:hypothetical protein